MHDEYREPRADDLDAKLLDLFILIWQTIQERRDMREQIAKYEAQLSQLVDGNARLLARIEALSAPAAGRIEGTDHSQ